MKLETKPFLIIGLPRSQTAWLANYFTQNGRICHHERMIDVQFNFNTLISELGKKHGNADASLILKHKEVIELHNQGKINLVLISRKVPEVTEALFNAYKKAGYKDAMGMTHKIITSYVGPWASLLSNSKAMIVDYHSIHNVLPEIHAHLTPEIPFSKSRAEMLRNLNITQNIAKRVREYALRMDNNRVGANQGAGRK